MRKNAFAKHGTTNAKLVRVFLLLREPRMADTNRETLCGRNRWCYQACVMMVMMVVAVAERLRSEITLLQSKLEDASRGEMMQWTAHSTALQEVPACV